MSVHPVPALSPAPLLRPASAAQPVVAAAALEKRFDLRPVLRGVSFILPAGATMTLLGPNGAGKTTLLRVLSTLAKPTAGTVVVGGYDAERDAAAVRRIVGFVAHQPHLYDDLTARENLLFFARMYGLRDGRTRAVELLERVGLSRRANDLVRSLSRGQAQRLALARGILHDPLLLLLDEPDTGLDDEAAALLDELLRERRTAGRATIFATHLHERGLHLSDEALVLVSGRIAYCGPSGGLLAADVRALYDQARRARP